MPQITIQNINNTVTFQELSKTVLNIFQENNVDWMQACGGHGPCTTCKLILLNRIQFVSELSQLEYKMNQLDRLKTDERLACQCTPSGNLLLN